MRRHEWPCELEYFNNLRAKVKTCFGCSLMRLNPKWTCCGLSSWGCTLKLYQESEEWIINRVWKEMGCIVLGPKPFLMQLSVYVVKTQNPLVIEMHINRPSLLRISLFLIVCLFCASQISIVSNMVMTRQLRVTLDEGPRPKGGKSRLNLHGTILERKSIGSDQNIYS